MGYERTHLFQKKNSYTPQPTNRFASRPFAAPVQRKPQSKMTPDELENEAFKQNKYEAFGLQLKEKSGTITPVEQERLGVLQAKMDDFWAQREERTTRFGYDFSKVSVTPRETHHTPQLQPMWLQRMGTEPAATQPHNPKLFAIVSFIQKTLIPMNLAIAGWHAGLLSSRCSEIGGTLNNLVDTIIEYTKSGRSKLWVIRLSLLCFQLLSTAVIICTDYLLLTGASRAPETSDQSSQEENMTSLQVTSETSQSQPSKEPAILTAYFYKGIVDAVVMIIYWLGSEGMTLCCSSLIKPLIGKLVDIEKAAQEEDEEEGGSTKSQEQGESQVYSVVDVEKPPSEPTGTWLLPLESPRHPKIPPARQEVPADWTI